MDDIVNLGSDREPGRWPRRLAPIVILLVLAVVIVMHVPRGQTTAEHPPAATVPVGQIQLAGPGSGAASLLDRGGWVTGPGLPFAGTFRMVYLGQYTRRWSATRYPARVGRHGSSILIVRYMLVGGGSTVHIVRR